MPEEFETLTFPMLRESDSASRLRAIISDLLPLFSDDHSDGVLSDYITVLVCNGKSQRQAREDLEAFLGENSGEFVACLWGLLLKDFTQCSRSRRYNDYDREATDATYRMNEKLTAPREDDGSHESLKAKSMKMLHQELINSPIKKAQLKEKDDWNSSGVNYSRKILRSVVISAIKQPCGMNPDRYEKSMYKRSEILQKRPYLPEREMGNCYSQSFPSGGAVSAKPHDATLRQEMKLHVSVWDRLGPPSSKLVLDKKYPSLRKFGIEAYENKVLQQHGPAYSEQQSETITSTEPHTAYNLSRKRRYGIINPSLGDDSVGDHSSVLQYKQAKQNVEKPGLLSRQSAKPDLLSEILSMKQKMQQLEIQIDQAKKLKKQKVGELRSSPQPGEMQHQQDVTGPGIIHVTNVHYAAPKEAISMLFSKCGVVKSVTIVTDPVTRHPKGAAFVTFATKESVNKAIALSNTMFYSRPIKVWRHGR